MTTRVHFIGTEHDQYGRITESRPGDFLEKRFPDEVPAKNVAAATCEIEIFPDVKVYAIAWGDHVFVGGPVENWHAWVNNKNAETASEPFIKVEVVGTAFTKQVQVRNLNRKRQDNYYSYASGNRETMGPGIDSYPTERGYHGYGHDPSQQRYSDVTYLPYAYLRLKITAGDTSVEGELKFTQPDLGKCQLNFDPHGQNNNVLVVVSDFFGMARTWTESLKEPTNDGSRYHSGYDNWNKGLLCIGRHIFFGVSGIDADDWWIRYFIVNPFSVLKMDKLSSVMKRKDIKPVLDRLEKESPLDWTFFQWLINPKTSNKQNNNTLLAAFLSTVGTDYDALTSALKKVRANPEVYRGARHYSWGYGSVSFFGDQESLARSMCLALPGAQEKVQEQEAKADWRKRTDRAGQADGLGLTAEFPLLRKAVEAGEVPTSVFHQPNGEPVNVEFPLWEKAFARKGWSEVLCKIAQDCARRSTYEKDISPFIAFLFKIEKYLKKHTGKKWTAMPTFVESEWQLEMGSGNDDDDDDNPNGTVKRRSSFTPVADNETCTITVPFVAVCVSGVRTQWCYSRFYHLFEEGFTDPESGGIVLNDFEEKLNGRDDYGLMFYTLTGTDTARGYPTFLIIFERIKHQAVSGEILKTRVHFHRVRPQRKKDGKHTPACKLVEACYQYMAGNIPAKDICAQQGDLIFIRHPNDPIAAGAKTEPAREGARLEFESHAFEPVGDAMLRLDESTAKTPKNRLGFLYAPCQFNVVHPEHENLNGMTEGWYEIRRCRSYENNPRQQWSLTID